LAPVSSIANGMPCPSQIKWRLLPRLARSVGFGPVCSPQKPLAPNNCQRPHATSRSGHHEKANSATRNGSNPRFRPVANHATAANKQCLAPQPNSLGSICHGIPLRSTNRMPVRQARSFTRGRPLCGSGSEGGRSGSIKPHNASGTSVAAMEVP
jgi:hypothetical protein